MPQVFNGKLLESPMVDGIYEGYDEETYHADNAICNSDLKHAFEGKEINMARFWVHKHKLCKPVDSSGFNVGSVIHKLVLESEGVSVEDELARIAVDKGKRNFTKKDDKGWRDEQLESGRIILSSYEYNAALKSTDNILLNPTAKELLKNSKREVTIWKRCFETGLQRRCRVDIVSGDNGRILADLKSTADFAGPGAFLRTLIKYKYHQQAGYYLNVGSDAGLGAREFYFIVFEKDPPFSVAVHRVGEPTIMHSQEMIAKAMRRIKESNDIQIWKGYSPRAYELNLPMKWLSELDTEEFWND
jgi:hypothetical protein